MAREAPAVAFAQVMEHLPLHVFPSFGRAAIP